MLFSPQQQEDPAISLHRGHSGAHSDGAVVFARNMKAFGWCTVCVGSLMILLYSFLQCFFEDVKDEGVWWPSDTLIWSHHPLEGFESTSSVPQKIFVQLPFPTLSLGHKCLRIHTNSHSWQVYSCTAPDPCNWSRMQLLELFSAATNTPTSPRIYTTIPLSL